MVDTLAEDEVLDRITRTIAEGLQPRRIVLFGSRARGTATPDSDYDIMVEMETGLTDTARVKAVADLFPRRRWSMDVLVYTPGEIRRWKDDVGFTLYDIVREGRVLYRRPDVSDGDYWSRDVASPATHVRERPPEHESLAAWIDRAEEDWAVMAAVATHQPLVTGPLCFHAHQCAEKLLKACLIARSIRPPRTHDVRELLDACIRVGLDLESLRPSCQALYDLWPKSRYPHQPKPSAADARAALEAAAAIRALLLPQLAAGS